MHGVGHKRAATPIPRILIVIGWGMPGSHTLAIETPPTGAYSGPALLVVVVVVVVVVVDGPRPGQGKAKTGQDEPR